LSAFALVAPDAGEVGRHALTQIDGRAPAMSLVSLASQPAGKAVRPTSGGVRRATSSYFTYFKYGAPHESPGPPAARDSTIFQIRAWEANCTIVAKSVFSGLHHVYSRVHHDALKLPEDQGSPTTLGLFD